jgi:hypothetical protein
MSISDFADSITVNNVNNATFICKHWNHLIRDYFSYSIQYDVVNSLDRGKKTILWQMVMTAFCCRKLCVTYTSIQYTHIFKNIYNNIVKITTLWNGKENVVEFRLGHNYYFVYQLNSCIDFWLTVHVQLSIENSFRARGTYLFYAVSKFRPHSIAVATFHRETIYAN